MSGVVLCPSMLALIFDQPTYARAYFEITSKQGKTLLFSTISFLAVGARLNEAQRSRLGAIGRGGSFLPMPFDADATEEVSAITASIGGSKIDLVKAAAAHSVSQARNRGWSIASTTPELYELFQDVKVVDMS